MMKLISLLLLIVGASTARACGAMSPASSPSVVACASCSQLTALNAAPTNTGGPFPVNAAYGTNSAGCRTVTLTCAISQATLAEFADLTSPPQAGVALYYNRVVTDDAFGRGDCVFTNVLSCTNTLTCNAYGHYEYQSSVFDFGFDGVTTYTCATHQLFTPTTG